MSGCKLDLEAVSKSQHSIEYSRRIIGRRDTSRQDWSIEVRIQLP